MLSTVVVSARSVMLIIRSFMSLGTRPLKLQMMLTTGMLILGKMSVGVRKISRTPIARMRMAMTTNVYGRRNASRTIHIESLPAVSYFVDIFCRLADHRSTVLHAERDRRSEPFS